jgi:hypothetical protein
MQECPRQVIRRLHPLRYLHDCSGCFRLERLLGEVLAYWKAPPFYGARVKLAFSEPHLQH